MKKILAKFLSSGDERNADFTKKLIPNIKTAVLGIKVPLIKETARLIIKNNVDATGFFNEKHVYYEEILLHGFLIAYKKEQLTKKLLLLEEFLPYVNNWAVCDIVCQAFKDFKKFPDLAFGFVKKLISSNNSFHQRFAVVILLTYFSDKNFNISHLEFVKNLNSQEYYVNMAIAWYMSVLLIKQYDQVISLFEKTLLPKWIHNKSIQKAKESYRLDKIKKSYLDTLKIR